MCGIAGIVGPGASSCEPALVQMTTALRHRGPDGVGMSRFARCLLGHTRLSVIDVAGGAQPMFSADRAVAVVFNGEIYGYRGIRAELAGYPFSTQSDTEVLLALYDRHEQRMLDRLPGMFAFALWDDRRQHLFCARDRFGEKPLFYATAPDGTFVCASEIKGILASGLINPVIDPASVAHYLQYLYVHPHRTIYRNVHVLPPAHALRWQDGRVEVTRYWEFPECNPDIDVDEAVWQFRALLEAAVERQLVADVPVGAFLSGGLDSSTLVALAARRHRGCKTFSFGFGRDIDELPYARGIARLHGTDHRELSDSEIDLPELLVQMASVYDEPFGDSSNIPTYLLCKFARHTVKVALTGEGSDELLGGYTFWYRDLYDMDRAARSPHMTLARVVAGVCRRTGFPPPRWAGSLTNGKRWREKFDTPGAAHAARTAHFTPTELSKLLACSDWRCIETPSADSLDGVLRTDLATYLPGDILVKADRASMAHGLELRAPFLDWQLASFCLSLPLRLKITSTADKHVLRRAFAHAWTPQVRGRSKQGFGAPVAAWLARPAMQSLKHDVLGNRASSLYDFVSRDAVANVVRSNDYRTWALLVLAIWMESVGTRGTTERQAVDRVA